MLCNECGNENFEELYKNSAGDVYYACLACGVRFLVNSAGIYVKTFWERPERYISEGLWTDGVCLCCSSHDVVQLDAREHYVEYYCNACDWTFVVEGEKL